MATPDPQPKPGAPVEPKTLFLPSASLGPGERRPDPSRRWIIGIVVLILVAVIVRFAAPPVYQKVKRERGIRMAREANRRLDAGDDKEAVGLVQSALQFAPGDWEVARATARLCARTQRSEGLSYWGTVIASGNATVADQKEAVEMAIRYGRVDLSGLWLQPLYRAMPKDLAVLRLMLRHIERLGDRKRIQEFAHRFLQEFPTDPEVGFTVGSLLNQDSDRKVRDEGRRLLWELAAGQTTWRDAAVTGLAGNPELGRAELETLARLVESRTNAPLSARWVAVDLRQRLDPARKAEWVERAVSWVTPESPVDETATLVVWLGRWGSLGSALPLLPPERCRTNVILMAARLDVLVSLNRTQELAAMVTQESGALTGPLLAAAQAVLAAKSGKLTDAEALFRQALRGGTRVLPVLPFVATQAEAAGLPLVAIEAHQLMLSVPGFTLDSGRQLLRLVIPLADLTQARNTLRTLNAFMPGDEVVAAERAWLEAIFGENREFAVTTLERMATARPQQLSWRYGWALALWRKGDPGQALNLLEQNAGDFSQLEPRMQAAYVAVLGANNQREAARRFARRISQPKLRAQELELIAPWL
jgi:hypothetical protein